MRRSLAGVGVADPVRVLEALRKRCWGVVPVQRTVAEIGPGEIPEMVVTLPVQQRSPSCWHHPSLEHPVDIAIGPLGDYRGCIHNPGWDPTVVAAVVAVGRRKRHLHPSVAYPDLDSVQQQAYQVLLLLPDSVSPLRDVVVVVVVAAAALAY